LAYVAYYRRRAGLPGADHLPIVTTPSITAPAEPEEP